MGKTSTKLAVYALVQLLLFHFSGLVGAVDFHFFARHDHCAGPAYSFLRMPPYRCVRPSIPEAGSVRIQAMIHQMIGIYHGRECYFLILKHRGRGCVVGGKPGWGYTGVIWHDASELHEAEKACDAQAKPTGISYSEESTEGRWILTADNATEMYTQMDTIPDAQKVDWIQAHGATFQPDL